MLNFYQGTWDLTRNSDSQIADKNIDDKDDTKKKGCEILEIILWLWFLLLFYSKESSHTC